MKPDAAFIAPRSALLPTVALLACVFLWPALLTFHVGDWPSPHQYPHNNPAANACGLVGAWCAYYLRHVFGDGTYFLLLFATLAALLKVIRGEIGSVWERGFGLGLVVACTSASAHLICGPGPRSMPVGHGGLVGYALGDLLTGNLSRVGTIIVLTSSWLVGLIFTTQGWILKVPSMMGRAAQAASGAATVVRELAGGATARHLATATQTVALKPSISATQVDRPTVGENEDVANVANQQSSPPAPPKEVGHLKEGGQPPATASTPEKKTAFAVIAAPKPVKAPGGPIVRFPSAQQAALAEPYPRQIENWRLPSLTLLHEPEYGFDKQQEQFVRKQAKVLEETLQEFRIDAQVVEIDTGPVITMFELRLGAGIKVSQVATLSNDIARALKAHAIRVVAPISGKNTVGVEVPNIEKERVRLKELISLSGKKATEMGLPLYLGKDAGGAALVADLTAMPHLLIAGTTGSGKSVCLNAVILSILMTKRPDHVKMILIDPKMVEMSQFKDVPHLMCPLVTDMPRAEKILEWAVTKMDERYELLAEARVKNIAGYNALSPDDLYARFNPASEQEKAQISTHLPYIVIIIDELADLMMTAAKEVEHHLSRLAQKSRAVGIHIIVATQRPEVKVVTGLIKSNLPARICFRVASRMDSRIVLDQNGGEVLMGQGDMLFLPPGSHKLVRAQGTYLEETEVHAVLNDLASRSKPEFHPELIRLKAEDAEVDAGLRDPLFDDAVKIILESKRGSVSLLQRRLTIGYSRASRLIDQMAVAGIVGDYKGSQAREVMMTLDDWNAVRSQMVTERESGYLADQDEASSEGDKPWYDPVPDLSDDHNFRN